MPTDGNDILIAPSIIASDLTTMGRQAEEFDPSVVDLLHMDVMDGNFVPNLTFGPAYIERMKEHTPIPLDVHLMIERPERSVESYLKCRPWGVTIHYESTRFPARILSEIRKSGPVAGLAINPATPVEAVYDCLPYLDMVLVMSVDPGFYGQSFMEPAVGRIEKLARHLEASGQKHILIQVDGGINADNITRVARAGARIVVAGNAAFRGGDVNGSVAELKKRIRA